MRPTSDAVEARGHNQRVVGQTEVEARMSCLYDTAGMLEVLQDCKIAITVT